MSQMRFARLVLDQARVTFCQQSAAPLRQMRRQQGGCAAQRAGFVGVDDKQDLALLNPFAFLHALLEQRACHGGGEFEGACVRHEDAGDPDLARDCAPRTKRQKSARQCQCHCSDEAEARVVRQMNAAQPGSLLGLGYLGAKK